MLIMLMQTGGTPAGGAGPAGAAGAGFAALFGSIWCCAASMGVGQFVMAIIALVQVLSRTGMNGNDKLLWGLVSWFIPIVGPILWWTIGSKQHPAAPPAGRFGPGGPPGGPPAGPGQY